MSACSPTRASPIVLFCCSASFWSLRAFNSLRLACWPKCRPARAYESQDKPTYVIREICQSNTRPAMRIAADDKHRVTKHFQLRPLEPPIRAWIERRPVQIPDHCDPAGIRLESLAAAAVCADLVIGQPGLWPLVRYELTILLAAWIPGALGLFLRSKLYPLILGRVGRNVAFGCNVVLRHPHKIQIADDVVVDDNCCLDAKGTTNHGIVIRRGVFLGRNTILSCKNGDILLDEDANLGFNVEVYSAANVRDWPAGSRRGLHLPGWRRSSLRSRRCPGPRRVARPTASRSTTTSESVRMSS